MNASSSQYAELEIQLGRALTETVAPDEVQFFDDIVAASTAPAKKRDHTLGFGIPADDMATISAGILVLCKPILAFVWSNACDAAGQLFKDATDQVRIAFEKRLSDWFKLKFDKPSPVVVPAEKLDAFLETLKKDAGSIGLDQNASDKLIETLRDSLKQ
jgi:hypothetical protein